VTGRGAAAAPEPAASVRRARTADVKAVAALVAGYVQGGILLGKSLVALYEDVQDFRGAELDGRVVGCGALHVLWEDLGELRTVAVDPAARGRGVGHRIVDELIATARELGLRRLFVLTFEVEFFARHGFRPITGTPVAPDVYEELRRSYDEGVAEFLDLDRVKPNVLGNTRMLLTLEPGPAVR
jgi:amino-acid N-acetyltransferase